jgi:hypothetical protein
MYLFYILCYNPIQYCFFGFFFFFAQIVPVLIIGSFQCVPLSTSLLSGIIRCSRLNLYFPASDIGSAIPPETSFWKAISQRSGMLPIRHGGHTVLLCPGCAVETGDNKRRGRAPCCFFFCFFFFNFPSLDVVLWQVTQGYLIWPG